MITVHVEGHVAHLQLNRPEKLNAVTPDAWAQIPARLDEAVEAGARVVVFSGAGRAFTAGLDLMQAMATLPVRPGGRPTAPGSAACTR